MPNDHKTAIGGKFSALLQEQGVLPICATSIDILQVNLGYLCNLSCKHCHVQAGPHRTEMMNQEDIEAVLHALKASSMAGEPFGGVYPEPFDFAQDKLRRRAQGLRSRTIPTLDLTGGAPELHPQFRFLVTAARAIGCQVMVRTNLAVFFEPGQDNLPAFFHDNEVEVIASLPCYLSENVDSVRGSGVFAQCIKALRLLNDFGYGDPNSKLKVHLIYNPMGASLPPAQEDLERQYRQALLAEHGVRFNRLYTLANMPLGRFKNFLIRTGGYDKYLEELQSAFNLAALDGIMCRRLVNVGWDGALFDCDFNATVGLRVMNGCPPHIKDFDYAALCQRQIVLSEQCFGCTAGQGFT